MTMGTFKIVISILKNRYVQGIVSIIVILFLVGKMANQKAEIKRQSENYEILATDSSDKLRLTKDEFEIRIKNDEAIRRVLRDSLGVKAKQVVSLMKASSNTQIRVKTVIRDSLILNYDTITNKVIDTVFVKVSNWSDDWSSIKCIIVNDSVDHEIHTYDDLVLVNHWYKKGGWFLPKLFSKRHTKIEIVNSNPNAVYNISQRIDVLPK